MSRLQIEESRAGRGSAKKLVDKDDEPIDPTLLPPQILALKK